MFLTETIGGKGVMKKEYLRMAQWLLLSIALYGLATWLNSFSAVGQPGGMFPRVQAVLWKCAHLNLAAYLGYWIDRNAFRDRIVWDSSPVKHIRRAIIIGATMLSFGMAL
jgi:hypothetical protein